MYPTTRCGLGTATAPQSATACDHAEPSGGESMEEDLRAPAPRKPRNQTSKWDPQDRVGFRSESRLLHKRMISYINTYKKQRGPGAICLVLDPADRGFHYLTRLSQSRHKPSQRKNLKR